jgi:hypothetical protein
MKMGPDALGTAKKSQGAQNVKIVLHALCTTENGSGSIKLES